MKEIVDFTCKVGLVLVLECYVYDENVSLNLNIVVFKII
jgi:hypothetical protein